MSRDCRHGRLSCDICEIEESLNQWAQIALTRKNLCLELLDRLSFYHGMQSQCDKSCPTVRLIKKAEEELAK